MNVAWLEQNETDVPLDNRWLGATETVRLGTMRFAKRRADWRLGRWTAKCALASHLHLTFESEALARFDILAAPSGSPEVFFDGHKSDVTISLSHRAGRALCAVGSLHQALGCDLELVEPRSSAFVVDYFSTEEQALVVRTPPADRLALITLLWSAKESALKALRTGLRADTRSVIVCLDIPARGEQAKSWRGDAALSFSQSFESDRWHALSVHAESGERFHGYWQRAGEFLRTIVAAPPTSLPSLLHPSPKNAHTHPPFADNALKPPKSTERAHEAGDARSIYS